MKQADKNTATYKVDATGSDWSHKRYAVYKRFYFLGLSLWFIVHYDSTIQGCEDHIRDALTLPRYYS